MIHIAVWVFGALLAVVWFSRVLDAALGMPHVPELTQAKWERAESGRAPRVSIIAPARNEEESIGRCLECLLALE